VAVAVKQRQMQRAVTAPAEKAQNLRGVPRPVAMARCCTKTNTRLKDGCCFADFND